MKLKLLRPVPKEWPISSPFGKMRIINGEPTKPHKGIDFACPVGTPIHAVADGLCVRAGWENPSVPKQGFGLRIMQHIPVDGISYYIFYGHCNKLLVEPNQKIQKGDVIAQSGNTGSSTGPHLHIGARRSDSDEFCDIEFYEEAIDERIS